MAARTRRLLPARHRARLGTFRPSVAMKKPRAGPGAAQASGVHLAKVDVSLMRAKVGLL